MKECIVGAIEFILQRERLSCFTSRIDLVEYPTLTF